MSGSTLALAASASQDSYLARWAAQNWSCSLSRAPDDKSAWYCFFFASSASFSTCFTNCSRLDTSWGAAAKNRPASGVFPAARARPAPRPCGGRAGRHCGRHAGREPAPRTLLARHAAFESDRCHGGRHPAQNAAQASDTVPDWADAAPSARGPSATPNDEPTSSAGPSPSRESSAATSPRPPREVACPG